MKIRSITYFLNPGWPVDPIRMQEAGDFIAAARPVFEAEGYQVQTARLATLPFPRLVPSLETAEVVEMAQALENQAKSAGYEYVSVGPALPHLLDSYPIVVDVLAATENVFLSGLMTTENGGVSLPAVYACADIIRQASTLTPDGFANLRFAALANVESGAPFFPAAYYAEESPTFALATEAAGLAVEAFTRADNLDEARLELINTLLDHAQQLSTFSEILAQQFQLSFAGIDFSPAPFPQPEHSLGTALEAMGLPALGQSGSLAAAAILADTLDRAEFEKVGFNGLMLPVLEDATLAARAAEGTLTVKDLLLYSAVCGTGLDTVPLPGDTTTEQLAAVLLDLASLSQRLDKPLTARLMPIPGKAAGDQTDFDFAYFANSRVLALQAAPLQRFLAGEETFHLQPRS